MPEGFSPIPNLLGGRTPMAANNFRTLLDPACHLDIARAIITRNDRRAYSLSVAGVAADLVGASLIQNFSTHIVEWRCTHGFCFFSSIHCALVIAFIQGTP